MPMPATRKSKSKENGANLRRSTRKREKSNSKEKAPKRTRRKAVKFHEELSKYDAEISEFFKTPSKNEDRVCAFYKVSKGENGESKFSQSLIKYFMTIDSPEMDNLRLKRFNSSFLRETPKNRDSLKIFSDEDDNSKYLENVPHLESNMPEIPGLRHANAFESIPLISDSDSLSLSPNKKKKKRKCRKSRCVGFQNKPLPDECIMVDYSSLLNSESNSDNDSEDANFMQNSGGILYSLLNSPSIKKTPHSVTEDGDNLLGMKDEMLMNKYKDILPNKELRVVLTRLPIDFHSSQSNKKKK